MRTLLALTLVPLPLVQAQDSRLLRSVEPDYAKYSPDLAADFETVIAPVTMTVRPNGKPSAFNSVPLPMAVVMALKDYEFRPPDTVPHGRLEADTGAYEITLKVPIRQSKESGVQDSAPAMLMIGKDGRPAVREGQGVRIGPGLARGMLLHQVRATYPASAKDARIQGTVTLETVISKQGEVAGLKVSNGPFELVEAAYDSVRQWKFRPFLENREPVEVVAEIGIVFSLQ